MMKCVTEIKARLRSIDALNLEIRSVSEEIKTEKNEIMKKRRNKFRRFVVPSLDICLISP